jgi:hypothetical protein
LALEVIMSHQLELSIVSLQDEESLKSPLLLQTYKCWKKIWSEAYLHEWGLSAPFYADKLKKHKEIIIIHEGTTPIAFFTLNQYLTSNCLSMDDSYFEVWNELALHKLSKIGKRIFTMENFTIAPEFRKYSSDVNFKELIGIITVSRLYHSNFDATVATPRIKRKVEKEAHRMGAKVIAADLPYTLKDERIDLVYWTKDYFFELRNHKLYDLGMSLWNQKKVIGNISIIEPLIEEKKLYAA